MIPPPLLSGRQVARISSMVEKRWWVTLYWRDGQWFGPLADVRREDLEDMLTGHRDYKLELLTQEERNARDRPAA